MLFIVNTPGMFGILWKFAKLLLDKDTLSKIKIFSNNGIKEI